MEEERPIFGFLEQPEPFYQFRTFHICANEVAVQKLRVPQIGFVQIGVLEGTISEN